MAKLAIKGHSKRGKEVIEILEMLGGENTRDYSANYDGVYFYIKEDSKSISFDWFETPNTDKDFTIYDLEEFLEKFPYKIGYNVSSKYLKNYKIEKMEWEDTNNRVIYKLQGMGWYSVSELQPYKEEDMETKTNIAELLKDCPQGMELYSPIFGEVYLDKIRPHLAIVVTTDKEQGDFKEEFLYDGRYGMNGECMLFPSKDQRDWSKFQRPFKDGDILATDLGSVFYLNTRLNTNECYGCYVGKGGDGSLHICEPFAYKECCGLATEEEKQKLFKAIKDNGYKWNAETKTLEKLPKFKAGDKIEKCGYRFTIKEVREYNYLTKCGNKIPIDNQDDWVLVPNKFDITTLKPFDSKVLVRSSMDGLWKPAVFGFRNGYNDNAFYIVGGSCWKQCIPYLNNEHLCGTTNDCDEFYKTWK